MAVEPKTIGDILFKEEDKEYSRDRKTLAVGEDIDVGAIVGSVLIANAVTVGTGDGVTGAVTFGMFAEVGDYVFTCITAVANSGDFQGVTPSGNTTELMTVGTAFVSGHLNFTQADGAADFIVGDTVTITVTEGDLKQIVQTATDGTQIARGIVVDGIDATSAAVDFALIVRDAIIKDSGIDWGVTYDTDAKKDVAILQLRKLGIITREAN